MNDCEEEDMLLGTTVNHRSSDPPGAKIAEPQEYWVTEQEEHSFLEEEECPLLEQDECALLKQDPNEVEQDSTENGGSNENEDLSSIITIRFIGFVTLFLLFSSNAIFVGHQIIAGPTYTRSLSRLRLDPKMKSKFEVRKYPRRDGTTVGYIEPNQIVEAYKEGTQDFHHIITPIAGFVMRNGPVSGREYFQPVDNDDVLPGVYEGWWPPEKKLMAHDYAPTSFVVAQQLWNGMQVIYVYLLISLCFRYLQEGPPTMYYIVGGLTIASLIIFPFAVYVISIGGHVLSLFALVMSIIGIRTTKGEIKLSMAEISPSSLSQLRRDDVSAPRENRAIVPAAWMLAREETLAFCCNMCSSLYNCLANKAYWPHWYYGFRATDRICDFVGSQSKTMDVTAETTYTLGLDSSRMPLFVNRAYGSATGTFMFYSLWIIIPFFYVSYFGFFFAMSYRSPGVRIQQVLALFGMFHFLFMTDAVAYKYGRGLNNPNWEFFHWMERFAWRIAIFLPIYQNCTNGHWKRGHRYSFIGKAFHYFMGIWGCMSFLQQVVFSDIFRFSAFLNGDAGWKNASLKSIMGFKIPHVKYCSYLGGLTVNFVAYAFVLVCGFSHYGIFIQPKDKVTEDSSCKTFYRGKTALKCFCLSILLTFVLLAKFNNLVS